jgi:hypothetical protein
MKKIATTSSAYGAMLLILAGCGGGGGGETAAAPTELVDLTSANAKTVAGAAVVSSMEGGDLGAYAMSAGPTAGVTATKSTQIYSKVGEIQSEQIDSLVKQSQAGYMQAAVGPVTSQCEVGGSVTISGDVSGEQTLSSGDNITIEFADCDDGVSVVDGTFSMTITSFSGDLASGMFSLGVSLELTAFAVTEGEETVTANGDVTMALDALSSPVVSMTVSSSSLAVSEGGASHELTDYSSTRTVDTVTGEYSIEASGTVTSSAFDGAASFDVIEPFTGTGAAYPGSGELLIEGAGGATLRVIALDTTFVRIELDSDGDGTADEIIDSTWDELT